MISGKENGFPKIITGIRRCGKSFLLIEIFKNYLLTTGVKEEQIIVIELDEIKNTKYRNPFPKLLENFLMYHAYLQFSQPNNLAYLQFFAYNYSAYLQKCYA